MPTRNPSAAVNAENRALRREQQFKKRLAVIENIGRPGGITNSELCAMYGFLRIDIQKQADFLSLDVKWTIDENGHRRYTPARPMPTLSAVVRHPSGDAITGLTPAEAASHCT